MIVICGDCEGSWPGQSKEWRMPCAECRNEFVARHEAMGHVIRTRPETKRDLWAFSGF